MCLALYTYANVRVHMHVSGYAHIQMDIQTESPTQSNHSTNAPTNLDTPVSPGGTPIPVSKKYYLPSVKGNFWPPIRLIDMPRYIQVALCEGRGTRKPSCMACYIGRVCVICMETSRDNCNGKPPQ